MADLGLEVNFPQGLILIPERDVHRLKLPNLFQQVSEWPPIKRIDRFVRAAIHQWQQLFCQMQQFVIVY